MAKSKTTAVKYSQRRLPNGKMKLVKVGKEKVVNTNVSKGSNTAGKPWNSDKAALASERISESARTKRAEIAARSVDIANIANAANSMTKNIAGSFQQSTQQQSPAVQQAVEGGLTPGGNSRDDDDANDLSDFVA